MKSVFKEQIDYSRIYDIYNDYIKSRRISRVLEYVEDKKRVLDIGCSFGYVSYYLAKKRHCTVDAFDINAERISIAQKHFKDKRIKYHDKNILLTKKRDYYDYIIFLEVVEHVENPYEFLSFLLLLLKPGGYLIVSTPNANDYLQNIRNIRLFTKRSRHNIADRISVNNKVKYGDMDDHLYNWTWDTFFRLLDRVGFEYIESDIVAFNSISYGNFHLFNGSLLPFEYVFKPFCSDLIFKVRKPLK